MRIARTLLASLLLTSAAGAQQVKPLIDRPVILPARTLALTLHGTYSNWDGGIFGLSGSVDGETLAAGVDYGLNDQVEVGLAAVFPVHPGAAFGSILGTASIAMSPQAALRLDAGWESIGANGDVTSSVGSNTNRFLLGIGAPLKIPLSPTVAFVSGRTGAAQFGHFINVGQSGVGLYFGSSAFTESSSDFFVFSKGDNSSSTNFGINLPLGLLLQADPRFAVTLQAGYAAAIEVPETGSSIVLHFIPVALEAVFTPSPPVDIGFRFFVDGFVAQTGGSGGVEPGYFDLRALMLWFRVRT